jgi:PAS domain S-box-containing protein
LSDGPGPQNPGGSLRSTQRTLQAVLQQVEERPDALRDILAAAPEALIAFDAGRRILTANARAEAIFGYDRGALDGWSTDLLVPARLRQPDAPPMTATDDLMQVDLPGLLRDGTERAIEWCFGSARRSQGAIFVMTVRDRLELDRALDALRASEERFQLLVNGVRDCAIFMLDGDGRVSSWNAGAARIQGWTPDEVLGRPYPLFFSPEDRASGLPDRLLAAALHEGSHEATGWRLRKDGTRFWAHTSLTVLRNADDQVRGFAQITRDLTERVRAEDNQRRLIAERASREAAEEAEHRLRASEERLGRLQRVTAALSEAVTPEDVSTVVLRECVSALGAGGGAVYVLTLDGNSLKLVGQRGHPDEALETYRRLPLDAPTPLSDAARERTPGFYESFEACWTRYPALRAAIGIGNFEASVALPLVGHGQLVGVLGVRFEQRRSFDAGDRALLLTISDLCSQALERARLFDAERQARASAESASRSKDEFLAMLGHELRNPLAPIATAVHLMKLRGDDRLSREREVIERQLLHLSKLVDDLLDVSRVARGLVSLSRTPIEVAEILSEAVEMASPLLEQRAQQLTVAVPKVGLSINADRLRLAQVVANLLTNAAKYTPPHGHVWLSAAREGGQVVIRVRDDGEGIGPELLPRVFDLFVQGRRTIARSEGGLGLGLALVKSLVTLHGGTVGASSEGAGRGSEFVVRIPWLDAVAPGTRPLPGAEGRPARPEAKQNGKRILLVDDNQDASETLADVLRELGHEVEVAADGPTALRQLRAFAAEVAILDLGLPVMDGFELARRVCEERAGARPRLIALTGYGRERDFAQSRAVGFDVHLVKPVDLPTLVAALEPGGAGRAPAE